MALEPTRRARDRHPAARDRFVVPFLECVEDPSRRLVPDRHGHRRVHALDDVEARAGDSNGPVGAGNDASGPLHFQHCGQSSASRTGHRGVPDQHRGPRAARIAAQSQAQQGVA